MEDESGAKILIRGKGSSKDPSGDPDDEDELHVLITADTDEAIAKAQSAVEDILFNPQQAMKLKQEQLRKYVFAGFHRVRYIDDHRVLFFVEWPSSMAR